MLEGIDRLIDSVESEPANFPPKLVYNEGWLLKLILYWHCRHKIVSYLLLFQRPSLLILEVENNFYIIESRWVTLI